MKNIYSKNTIIALSIGLNVLLGAYLVSAKAGFTAKPQFAKTQPSTKKAVRVEGVSNVFNNTQLQKCYNALLKKQPEVDEGIVQLHMKLNESGAIDQLELVKNDLKDETFTQCVLSEIRSQRFPASVERSGMLISHKFTFHRKDQTRLDFDNE